MPSRIVTIKPPGSFPGVNSFAIAPTISPTRIVERIEPKVIVTRVVSVWFGHRKQIGLETIDAVATRLWRVPPAQRREKRPIGLWLQLDHLRRVNVLAR